MVENQKEEINALRKDNFNLRNQFQQLEQLFKKLVNFLKKMFSRKDKKEVYTDVINDMYNNQIISEKTYDSILGINSNLSKERDDELQR